MDIVSIYRETLNTELRIVKDEDNGSVRAKEIAANKLSLVSKYIYQIRDSLNDDKIKFNGSDSKIYVSVDQSINTYYKVNVGVNIVQNYKRNPLEEKYSVGQGYELTVEKIYQSSSDRSPGPEISELFKTTIDDPEELARIFAIRLAWVVAKVKK